MLQIRFPIYDFLSACELCFLKKGSWDHNFYPNIFWKARSRCNTNIFWKIRLEYVSDDLKQQPRKNPHNIHKLLCWNFVVTLCFWCFFSTTKGFCFPFIPFTLKIPLSARRRGRRWHLEWLAADAKESSRSEGYVGCDHIPRAKVIIANFSQWSFL